MDEENKNHHVHSNILWEHDSSEQVGEFHGRNEKRCFENKNEKRLVEMCLLSACDILIYTKVVGIYIFSIPNLHERGTHTHITCMYCTLG